MAISGLWLSRAKGWIGGTYQHSNRLPPGYGATHQQSRIYPQLAPLCRSATFRQRPAHSPQPARIVTPCGKFTIKCFSTQGAERGIVNRKQFIQSRGATCRNWTWSWSFINHDEQFVIFGAWDTEREKERAVILREEWEFSASHKRQPGYTQATEHIGFILQGYELFTFNMVHAPNPDNPDVAVIKNFERRLDHRFLRKEGTVWYADFSANTFPDELPVSGSYIEGAKKSITVNAYERDPEARQACIRHHGAVCKCCGFDFEKTYGKHGKGFIHVHHIRPLRTLGEGYQIDPVTELVPLCPNCHAMIHRGNEARPLSVDELRSLMNSQN